MATDKYQQALRLLAEHMVDEANKHGDGVPTHNPIELSLVIKELMMNEMPQLCQDVANYIIEIDQQG